MGFASGNKLPHHCMSILVPPLTETTLTAVSFPASMESGQDFLVPKHAIQADFLSVTTIVFFLCLNNI